MATDHWPILDVSMIISSPNRVLHVLCVSLKSPLYRPVSALFVYFKLMATDHWPILDVSVIISSPNRVLHVLCVNLKSPLYRPDVISE